jgi:hypothetical protein
MPAPVASRPAEARAVADFLTAAAIEPAALVMEGEPGIGKTTLWLHAVEEARERGFRRRWSQSDLCCPTSPLRQGRRRSPPRRSYPMPSRL